MLVHGNSDGLNEDIQRFGTEIGNAINATRIDSRTPVVFTTNGIARRGKRVEPALGSKHINIASFFSAWFHARRSSLRLLTCPFLEISALPRNIISRYIVKI